MAAPPELRLKRFLHYACEEGMYVAQPRKLEDYVVEKLKCMEALIAQDEGGDLIILPTIVKVFQDGTSITPNAIMFVLAVCATQRDSEKLRINAQKKVRELSLNEEDLFNFAHYCFRLSKNKGGRGMFRTITRWYANKSAKDLAEIVVVKSKIHRMRHSDLIKLYHMKSEDRAKQAIYSYLITGLEKTVEAFKEDADTIPEVAEVLNYIKLVEKIKTTKDTAEAIEMLTEHRPMFPHQCLPPALHRLPEVWAVLLPDLPFDDLVSMTQHFFKLRLLKSSCPISTLYIDRITNEVIPTYTKIDPISVFIELRTYEMLPRKKEYFKMLKAKGHDVLPEAVVIALRAEEAANATDNSSTAGDTKKKEELYPTFKVNKRVSEALNGLVLRLFRSLRSTGLRYLIGVDTRNIMSSTMYVKCPFVKSIEAAALLLLSFLNSEDLKHVTVTSFLESSQPNVSNFRIEEIPGLGPQLSVTETTQILASQTGGPVNVLKFFDWAVARRKEVDVFVIISTSSIVACDPFNAMAHYTEHLKKKDIKLITVSLNGMCSRPRRYHRKTNMLYVNGFDDKVWRVIQSFSQGTF